MPDTTEADDLVNSPAVQKYIAQIEADADDALAIAKTVLSGMSSYPSKFISEYKADESRLDKAWGDFNAEWNRVVFGKAKNSKALIAAYSRFVIALTILEEQNVRFGAFVKAKFALFAASFIAFFILVIKANAKRFAKLKKDLIELQSLLKKAKREVTEAKAQLALNAALTVVTLCLGPAGWAARAGIAAASFTAHIVIDASLGPSKGSAVGTLNQAAGDVIGVPDKIKGPWGKIGGAASGVLTLGLDVGEIGDAKKIVKRVQDKIRAVARECVSLQGKVQADAKKLTGLRDKFKKALKTAESNAGKYKSKAGERKKLIKEFNKWK